MSTNDGLEEFKKACLALNFDPIPLVVKTAKWVDPVTYKALPVWYPDKARKAPMYLKGWTTRQLNNGEEKTEANQCANKALKKALGLSGAKNWTVCHIWGFDDPKFQTKSKIVQDPRYYSNIANMVLLPTPLKAFTDSIDEIKVMLKICAYHLYGFICEEEGSASRIKNEPPPKNYPNEWPTADRRILPPGVVKFNPKIQKAIQDRKYRIRQDLKTLYGTEYPKNQVISVLREFPGNEPDWWEK